MVPITLPGPVYNWLRTLLQSGWGLLVGHYAILGQIPMDAAVDWTLTTVIIGGIAAGVHWLETRTGDTPGTPNYLPPEIVAGRIRTIWRTSGRCMTIRASSVTSRALDTWPGASRPSGRTKCVSRRPSCRARWFISASMFANSR